ncbi:MAG: hypothetical protein IPO58_00920 [Betaproteobacteria bacterium]|nr:hypothetical protein [Betaproteobacteria bacterium]
MATFAGSSAHLAHSPGFATLHEMLHAALARCWMTLEHLFARTAAPYY